MLFYSDTVNININVFADQCTDERFLISSGLEITWMDGGSPDILYMNLLSQVGIELRTETHTVFWKFFKS